MGMGAILLLEISTPVNLNLLWFLILLKKEQIPEYLVSSPSVLRCPHVRPAVSLSYFNPQVFQTACHQGPVTILGRSFAFHQVTFSESGTLISLQQGWGEGQEPKGA